MITDKGISKDKNQNQPEVIHLTKNNMSSYGFTRLCYPNEAEKDGDNLAREIELPNEANISKLIKFVFPESELILLSKDKTNRVSEWEKFSIDSAQLNADHMFLLSQRAGWNQTINDVKEFAMQNPNANLLANINIDGISNPLGSGLVLKVGENLSWIGMILVHPEVRRQGIANAIMEECISFARLHLKTPLVGLDATPAGVQVYKRMGFRESFTIWRCSLATAGSNSISTGITVENSFPIELVIKYLENVKLIEKLPELKLIFKLYPEGVFIAKEKDNIIGFAMSRPGRLKPFIGPVVANNLQIAQALLEYTIEYWSKKGFDNIFIDIPEKHFEIKSELDSDGACISKPENCKLNHSIVPERNFVRMYEAPDIKEAEKLLENNSNNTNRALSIKHASMNAKKTNEFMIFEKNEMLRWIYSIGGPELS